MDLREKWLNDMTTELRPIFQLHGLSIPEKIKISCGFTSKGTKSKAVGECWDPSVSRGGFTEIFISPTINNSLFVASVLVHELVHACLGMAEGHGKKFAEACTKLHLKKPWTSTSPDEGFDDMVQPLINAIGEYPHECMDIEQLNKKKQPHIKHVNLRCPIEDCEVFIKTAQHFIADGMEFKCPDHKLTLLTKAQREELGLNGDI